MVSKTVNRILERLEKLNERVRPVVDYAERLERIEAKLDQLLEAQKPTAQGAPASTSRATITATPAKAADKK